MKIKIKMYRKYDIQGYINSNTKTMIFQLSYRQPLVKRDPSKRDFYVVLNNENMKLGYNW